MPDGSFVETLGMFDIPYWVSWVFRGANKPHKHKDSTNMVFQNPPLYQGMKTRIPKVVPRKVPPNILQIWPLYSLRDS